MENRLPETSRRKNDLPIDRGWAWVICAAVFANHYLVSNSFQVLAVTLLDLKAEFNTSLTTVSLILMVKTLCMSFTSIVSVNVLVPRFGLRQVSCLAAVVYFVCGVGYASTSTVEAFIVLATIRGITIGVINVPAVNLLGFYFKRHRSLATTLAVSGASVSAISWPRLTRYIMSIYDLQGTLLLNGALEGHMILTALLLRPVTSYRSEPEANASPALTEQDCDNCNASLSTEVIGQLSSEQNSHFLPSNERECCINQAKTQNCPTDSDSKQDIFVHKVSRSTPLLEEYTDKQYRLTIGDENTKDLVKSENTNISCIPQEKCSFPVSNLYPASHIERTQLHQKDGDETLNMTLKNNSLHLSDVGTMLYEPLKSSPEVFSMVSRSEDNLNQCHRLGLTWPRHRGDGDGKACQDLNTADESLRSVLQNKSSSTSCIDTMLDRRIGYTSVSNLGSVLDFGHGVLACQHHAPASNSPTKLWHKVHIMFDFSLFKRWVFLWMLVASIPCGTNSFVFTYLPTMATLKGVSKDDGALLLVILGSVDLGSRLVMGLVADSKYFKISTIIGVSCVCLGTIFLFVEFYNDLNSLMAMSVALGLFVGIRSSLITVLFIEVLGVEKMAKAFSMFTVFITLSVAGHGPLLGHMMETIGVNTVMYYMGLSMICGGVVVYTLPLVLKLELAWKRSTKL